MSKSDPLLTTHSGLFTRPGAHAENHALLEAIIRSSNDAIITKTLDGTITSWNPAATRIFGYEPAEIIGQSILRLIPERLQHEEAEIIRSLKAGRQIEHYETTRVTRSGAEIFVSLTISPIKDASGRVVGASKIARNITRQRQVDRARLQLAAIVESSDDAIISKDLDGIITSWNNAAARLFGYSEEEIVGRSILTLIPPDLHNEEPIIIGKLLAGERIEHFETMRLTRDGRRIDVSLTISPIKDETGRVIGASKVLRDISDRKRLQVSLLQAEKIAATGRMAASIAHEINNPLEALLNLIYLARLNADRPEEVRGNLEAAEGELARVSHIARQTLGYYRENVSPRSTSLADLVTDVLHVYQPRLTSNNVRVKTNLATAPALLLKRGEIMQVISNLIANAIHAMQQGGEITLTVRPAQRGGSEFVVLDVQDTGTGISHENLQHIFEPFFTTRPDIGTGIGLWVAQQFVHGHGGTVEISSSTDPITHGTTIGVFLPVVPPASVDPQSLT